MGAILSTMLDTVWRTSPDDESETLKYAAQKGDRSLLVELVQQSGAGVNSLKKEYDSALVTAASHGHDECLDLLIQAGADVNRSGCGGSSAIVSAAWHGHKKCLELLLTAGADVNSEDEYGNTVLTLATWNGHVDCAKYLIDSGADVNAFNIEGSTAVFFAASEGHVGCLEILVQGGARVNETDITEDTALLKATVNNHVECVNVLLTHGADVNMCDKQGNTALIKAAESGFTNCAELLIKAGADVNIAGHNLYATPLMQAARFDWHECVNILIKAGADVNAADFINNTILMSAVGNNSDLFFPSSINKYYRFGTSRIQCVQLILAAGALVNKTNVHGQSALFFHRQRGVLLDREIPMLLIAAGEILDDTNVTIEEILDAVYDTGFYDMRLNLKHLCRETIRARLIDVDAHRNLFTRVPKLGLPKLLAQFLLYDMSLSADYPNDTYGDDYEDSNSDDL